jgi:hypothetical protein
MRLAMISLGFVLACSDGSNGADTAADASVVDDSGNSMARSCSATKTGWGPEAERLDVMLVGTRPLVTELSSNGAPVSRWTYAYDEQDRLVVEEQDCCSSGSSAPDGVPDRAREIVHGPTAATESWVPRPAGSGASESVTYTLDANDRVLMYASASSQMSFMLDAVGRLVRTDEDAVDIDLGPYTRQTEYTYDGDRLARRRVVDTRSGSAPYVTTYVHAVSGNRIDVDVGTRHYVYTSDSAGRLLRAEVDEDGGGTSDWIVEATYGDDGVTTIKSTRDGLTFGTHTFDAGCGYSLEMPTAPVAWSRPTAHWGYLQPAFPNAYE